MRERNIRVKKFGISNQYKIFYKQSLAKKEKTQIIM